MIKYVRFESGSGPRYGILEGNTIVEIEGGLFDGRRATGARHDLARVKLLHPCEPSKLLAVGLNYRSHLRDRKAPDHPEIFLKPPSSLQDPGGPIALPKDSGNVHSEGELVLVIGKKVKDSGRDEAREAIFGVTCGNDVSERDWQHGQYKDLQWWRAKGSDTFAPLGPVIVEGIDYTNLHLETRFNGEVVQQQSTSDLMFDGPSIVQWVSRWVTLMPGDVIYTGTPGNTRKMNPGDVVEVEVEGIGVLRNPVVAG